MDTIKKDTSQKGSPVDQLIAIFHGKWMETGNVGEFLKNNFHVDHVREDEFEISTQDRRMSMKIEGIKVVDGVTLVDKFEIAKRT